MLTILRRYCGRLLSRDATLLQQVSDRLEFETAVLDVSLDAIITIDDQNRIVEWNRMAEGIFGYTKAEAVGQTLDIIIPPDFRTAHKRGMDHFKATGEGPVLRKRIEVEAMGRARNMFPVELAVAPIKVAGMQYFAARIRDISERIARERDLKQALEDKRLLLMELNHRVGNILAISSAVLRLQGKGNGEILQQALERMEALASEHHALSAADFKLSQRFHTLNILDHVPNDWTLINISLVSHSA